MLADGGGVETEPLSNRASAREETLREGLIHYRDFGRMCVVALRKCAASHEWYLHRAQKVFSHLMDVNSAGPSCCTFPRGVCRRQIKAEFRRASCEQWVSREGDGLHAGYCLYALRHLPVQVRQRRLLVTAQPGLYIEQKQVTGVESRVDATQIKERAQE